LSRSTPAQSNAPESEALTLEAVQVFEDARQAVTRLRKTFDEWVKIGKAVVLAREIADRRGGGRTFMRIIEQQGLGSVVPKQTATHLLRVMERINEVLVWHGTLTEKQQIDWASPKTVLRRCPTFRNPPPASGEVRRMTPAERDRQALAAALERVADLERQLSQRQDGDTFDYRTTPAKQIAKTVIGNLQPYPGKGRDFLREAQAELERLRAEARRRR
jgi:hypothetical protein